jgi:pilus assembly protein FimV
LSASEVSALSLGRINVLSALGEPLRAEIDVPNISTEEAASLKTNVASPAAFVAAGLEYNPTMSGLQVSLTRRSDGRSVIRLSSDRPINDPFIDIILEASWSSGRIVRDYTMLFDPPSLKASAPSPTLAQVPATVIAQPAAKASATAPALLAPVAEAPRASNPAKASVPAAPLSAKAATQPVLSDGQPFLVKPGDSASKIAVLTKGSDVSLDQMLVAMLRANPDAFSKGNLNRLRSGSLLNIPSAQQAQAVAPAEASQTVIAQSKDFNTFRSNLADSTPKATVEAASRQATGQVQAKVEDKKPSSAAADKLTLSKGAAQSKVDEAKLAKERGEKEAAARAAELAKNIADLKKLSTDSAKQAAPAPVVTASAEKPASALPAMEAPVTPKTAASAAPVAIAAASKPVASAPAKPASAPAPIAEVGLLDQLMEDPTLPLAGGGLLALLGGFFLYRRQQGKKGAAHVDSSFLESRLQPDSFFGASGGQHVDTAQSGAAENSSQGYSNSQLGSADDVDPVAEADVYLAYGRDMQAEEILVEALRHNPSRIAIHNKLLDIHVKRRDAAGFQSAANTAFQHVGADSPEWARICELGLSIDPQNLLYQPGGTPAIASVPLPLAGAESSATGTALAELPVSNTDLDLDLDFSADEPTAAIQMAGAAPTGYDESATVKMDATGTMESNGLDFDISAPAELEAMAPDAPQSLPELSLSMDDLSLDMPPEPAASLPDFSAAIPDLPEPVAVQTPEAKPNDGMLEFDLGSLSLDLGPSAASGADGANAGAGDESLETKLALAEEFVSIGDHDGARALIEEVVAEATGELREKAQRALSSLS